jgi:hypothetical protein
VGGDAPHASHIAFAALTQSMSQYWSQQLGSTAQTFSQQTASEQPGNTLVEQQSLGLVSP